MEILSPVWPDRRPLRLPKTRPNNFFLMPSSRQRRKGAGE